MVKFKSKRHGFLIATIAFLLLQFSLVSAVRLPKNDLKRNVSAYYTTVSNISSSSRFAINELYANLNIEALGLSKEVFDYAMGGLSYLLDNEKLGNDRIITIIDFSKPSTAKRLFIIDLVAQKVLFNTHVAHGMNSGSLYAKKFSNTPESFMSSLGFYKTENTYHGGNGLSLRLKGLEKGINDKALERDIVMHGADYVSEKLIRSQGFLGRSWGCPSVPLKYTKSIIEKIKGGSCLFIYSPDKKYIAQSKPLQYSKNDQLAFVQ